MLSAPHGLSTLPASHRRAGHHHRRRLAWLSALATLVATLVAAGGMPARAAQAPGDEVPTWQIGWNWTYSTVFRYVAEGTDVTMNETVNYRVAAIEDFEGQSAYRLDLTGTITSGSGAVSADGINATLSNFGGTVSGTRYMRRSDLALLQEVQDQHLTAKAQVSIISQNITADISLSMDPRRGWRLVHFPTQSGNSWTNDVTVDYDGGFSYDAGSIGGSGSETFEGELLFDNAATVANENLTVPAGTVSTRRALAQSTDGNTRATMWFAPTQRNAARLLLEIPQEGGGSLTLDQKLASSQMPAPSTSLTSTITPSLTCAGGDITVAGRLSTGAVGVPVTVALDKSPVTPGTTASTTTTTTTNGNYTAVLQAPSDADGYQRNGVRGSWGVITTAGGVSSVSSVLVTPQNCSAITYTGDTSAPQGTTATVSATLVDKTGASVAGRTVTFALPGGASVDATTNAAGVAQAEIEVAGPPRSTSITASYAGGSGLEAASTSTPFTVGAIATTTTVSTDPAIVTVGEPVRFTADVVPTHGATPSGTVQFIVDGAAFGSAVTLVDGSATSAPLSTLGLGDHTVVAVYSGSADNSGSSSAAVTFRVRVPLLPTTTTSAVSTSAAVYGEPVTLSATVTAASGTPTGEVVFTAGGVEIGRGGLGPDGAASVVTTTLPVDNNQIIATYEGDEVYAGSSASPRSVVVAKAAVSVELVSSDTSTVTGEAVGLTATVAVQAPGGGTPDGAVQLVVDGANVGSPVPLVNGSASFPSLTSLTAGNHTVAVSYPGSARYATGSDQLQQQVTAADTTVALVANPTPSVEEQEVALTATVSAVSPGSGNPTGTVTYFAGSESIGAAPLNANGTAVLEVSDLPPGTHQLTARFGGSDDYLASQSAEVAHTVLEGAAIVATTTTLSATASPSTYGAGVSFEAAVAAEGGGVPGGSVQFSVDGQDVGAPVPVDGSGIATLGPIEVGDPGDHLVIAAFIADAGWSGSGAILTQTVEAAPVELALSSSDNSAELGDALVFSVDVVTAGSGETPSGFVQFAVDGQPLGAAVAVAGGTATSVAIDDLASGAHTVTATYSGDARYRPALAQIQQDVARAGTTTTLSVADDSLTYGEDLVLTATVTPSTDRYGAPTGPVRFLVDGAQVATAPLAPTGTGATARATVTIGSLPAGSHEVRAVYDATPSFDGSSSAIVPVAVAKRATTVTAEAAVVSINKLGLPLGQLRATVHSGGQPLAGVPVEFKVGTRVVCTTTTNGTGMATCNAASQLLQLTLNGGYTATFLGDANHLSSTARGALLK